MASLFFYYGTMNTGKSTALIQAAYNYRERKMRPLIIKSAIDTRDGVSIVKSRLGNTAPCFMVGQEEDLYDMVAENINMNGKLDCLLVDEAQFLTESQVIDLCDCVDALGVPVLCYGLRTDFKGKLFPGSAALLAHANKLVQLKSVCHCGKCATHVLRLDDSGNVITDGPQVEVGGNDRYVAVCRKHHFEMDSGHGQTR